MKWAHTLVCILALVNIVRADDVKVTLNGSELHFEADTGALLRLTYPGVGNLLDGSRERSSLIDLAYPVKEFEALRLATRYSRGAKVTTTADAVEIHYEKLGVSRDKLAQDGNVSATIHIAAANDGRSLIFTAKVSNQSKLPVRQVLFPDLMGVVPIDGDAEQTAFRTSLSASRPFIDLAPNEDKLSTQYMTDAAAFCAEYQSGGMFHSLGLRWFDYGSLKGGFNFFARRWGFDPPITVRLHLSEIEQKLRILCRHDATIAPGASWESGEFWLTPHTGGWAAGIEPYRAWVKQNYKRIVPLSKRVREGIGYRTVWMCQLYPNDQQDVVFGFKDLPALAKESKQHGLDEMILWGWGPGFERPLPPPFPILGTQQDFADAVKACRDIGVNVFPFISVVQATSANAPKYGLSVGDNNGWTYHTELVPRWNPPYASALACVGIPTSNELWQKEVLESCNKLVDAGITSLGWDQYWTTNAQTPNMQTLTEKIRAYSRQRDPESTFCGEELWNLEIDSGYLDYTWNWGGYRDCRVLTSVLPTPRVNVCVSESPGVVRRAFADNLYLNVFPRAKESINGSDWIRNYPELSQTLKQCAALKKQFLTYFTEGTLIGDCVLTQPCRGAHVTAYTLGDRMLIVLINDAEPRKVTFDADLARWSNGSAKAWHAKTYDADGKLISETDIAQPTWHNETPPLKSGEMILLEITSS